MQTAFGKLWANVATVHGPNSWVSLCVCLLLLLVMPQGLSQLYCIVLKGYVCNFPGEIYANKISNKFYNFMCRTTKYQRAVSQSVSHSIIHAFIHSFHLHLHLFRLAVLDFAFTFVSSVKCFALLCLSNSICVSLSLTTSLLLCTALAGTAHKLIHKLRLPEDVDHWQMPGI